MSLQKIDDNDIIEMQRMIKEQLKKWLDEKFEEIDPVDYLVLFTTQIRENLSSVQEI